MAHLTPSISVVAILLKRATKRRVFLIIALKQVKRKCKLTVPKAGNPGKTLNIGNSQKMSGTL
jgi:hypothetical protein